MKGQIYTYVLTFLGAPIALFYPLIGLFIYINFAIVQPASMWYWVSMPPHHAKIVAIAMLVGWAMKGLGDWGLGRSTAVVLSLIGFLGWAVVGWAFCSNPPLAQNFLISMVKIILPFMVGMTLINTTGRLKGLVWTLVLSQGYVAYELNLSYYAGVNRLTFEGFGGMDNNYVAVAMVAGTGLAFFLGLSERRIWLKPLAFLAAVLMAHAVMFSFSRGGMLALIVTGVVAFLLISKKPMHVIAFILAVLIGLRLAGPQVRERFSSVFVDPEERDASATSRLESWKACWTVMKKEPVLGVGPNHWRSESRRYGLPNIEAHSLWMQTGAEMGFPGLALLLAFYGFCVVRLYPLTRRGSPVSDPWLRDAARAVIASLVGFGVAASFVSISGLELSYYVVLVGALVLKFSSMPARANGTPGTRSAEADTPVAVPA